MTHNVYIQGLSGAGFRVPKTGGGYGKPKEKVNVQVDLDNHLTQLRLASERNFGNFIRTSGSGATTATIAGLSRRGFRIQRSSDSAWVQVVTGGYILDGTKTNGVVTVDLTNASVRRILYRSKRDWFFASDPTALAIYGIQNEQNGFDVHGTATGTLTSNNTNVSPNDTVTIGTGTWVPAAQSTTDLDVETAQIVYTFVTNLTEVNASGTITTSGTGAANNDTVTVGSVTYTFKTSLTGAANEVLRDGTEDHDLTNLISAINATAGSGTTYGTGTVINPTVTAGTITSHVLTVTAKAPGTAGNSIVLTKTGSVLTVSGSGTLSGGVNAVANQIKIGGSADASLTNLADAVNGTGGTAGTNYSTGTQAASTVTVTGPTSHVLTFTATGGGSDVPVSKSAATLTWAPSTTELTGGTTSVYRGVSVTIDATKPHNYQQLRRFYDRWIEG